MLNSLLKFTNGIERHLKKIAFSTTNLLFRFSVISFYFFQKFFFVMVSQIMKFLFSKKNESIWFFGWDIINFEVRTNEIGQSHSRVGKS